MHVELDFTKTGVRLSWLRRWDLAYAEPVQYSLRSVKHHLLGAVSAQAIVKQSYEARDVDLRQLSYGPGCER